DVGRIGREVLAAQPHGDQRSKATDHQTLGVDHDPLLRHLGRLCRKGFHLSIRKWKTPRKDARRSGRLSREPLVVSQSRISIFYLANTIAYKYGAIIPYKTLCVWNGIGRRDMG